MSAYVVGLTGGIGSGKTTVTNLFEQLGVDIIDTDVIAHQLTAFDGAAMPQILEQFGSGMALPDGALDRAAMRQHVFTNPTARKRLEAILHPLIRAATATASSAANSPYVLVAVPLLIESGGWRERFDRVLVIDCAPETQVKRVMARNQLPIAEVSAILAAQASRSERLAIADDIISNDGERQPLQPAVKKLHQAYLALAAAKKPQANC